MNGWAKGDPLTAQMVTDAWVPYSAEIAADLIGWPVEQVREVFGDTVLVRQTLGGLEFGRPDPAPDSAEVHAEVTEIIAEARRKQTEAILNKARRGTLRHGAACSALRALGYAQPHAGQLAAAVKKGATVHVSTTQTTPASLADIINAIDWQRINAGFAYALMHGGNLPAGFLRESRRGAA